jgi:hypothetical protein
VSPVRYELGFYISEDGILHSHRSEKNSNLTLIFPSSNEGWETATQLGPLETANLNHWAQSPMLALSKGLTEYVHPRR